MNLTQHSRLCGPWFIYALTKQSFRYRRDSSNAVQQLLLQHQFSYIVSKRPKLPPPGYCRVLPLILWVSFKDQPWVPCSVLYFFKEISVYSFECSSPRKSLVKGEIFVRFEGTQRSPLRLLPHPPPPPPPTHIPPSHPLIIHLLHPGEEQQQQGHPGVPVCLRLQAEVVLERLAARGN